jgi:hypothetical protein
MQSKSKAAPLHATEEHGEKGGNSSYSYLTLALDGGEWSASRPGSTLPPGKEPLVPIGQEAGWAPESVWMQKLEEKSFAPAGDWTPVVQSKVSHNTDWATPARHTDKSLYNSENKQEKFTDPLTLCRIM